MCEYLKPNEDLPQQNVLDPTFYFKTAQKLSRRYTSWTSSMLSPLLTKYTSPSTLVVCRSDQNPRTRTIFNHYHETQPDVRHDNQRVVHMLIGTTDWHMTADTTEDTAVDIRFGTTVDKPACTKWSA